MMYYITIRPDLAKKFFRTNPTETPNFSKFASFTVVAFGVLLQVTALSGVFTNLKRRHEVKNFVISVSKLVLKEKYSKMFLHFCKLRLIETSCFYIPIMTFNFFFLMKPHFPQICAYIVIMYPSITMFGFVCFVKNVEDFVVVHLKEIKRELKEQNNFKNIDEATKLRKFLMISNKYQKLFNLLLEFHGAVGTQMTNSTCLLSAVIVFSVSRNLMKHLFELSFNFFRFSMDYNI